MKLYLVRHLQPLIAPGICYGRSDLGVDARVHAEAVPLLRDQLPADVPVYSSPLLRCAMLASDLSAEVRFDARLAELDFGAWELRTWDDIARAEIDAWAADVVHHRPGGGESVLDMACRISSFVDDLTGEQLAAAVLICHAGAIRLITARAKGLGPIDMAREAAEHPHAIAYGTVIVLESV